MSSASSGREGDADADADIDRFTVDHDGDAGGGHHGAGDELEVMLVGDAGEHGGELVASGAGEEVA